MAWKHRGYHPFAGERYMAVGLLGSWTLERIRLVKAPLTRGGIMA